MKRTRGNASIKVGESIEHSGAKKFGPNVQIAGMATTSDGSTCLLALTRATRLISMAGQGSGTVKVSFLKASVCKEEPGTAAGASNGTTANPAISTEMAAKTQAASKLLIDAFQAAAKAAAKAKASSTLVKHRKRKLRLGVRLGEEIDVPS